MKKGNVTRPTLRSTLQGDTPLIKYKVEYADKDLVISEIKGSDKRKYRV